MNNTALAKKTIDVLGKKMSYVELGQGDPIIFQHGNPTSSYLWRNIMPHVKDLGRCIAIDLIGMGDSEKLADSGPDRYTFVEHRKYFDAALAALSVEDMLPAGGVAVLNADSDAFDTLPSRRWRPISSLPASASSAPSRA